MEKPWEKKQDFQSLFQAVDEQGPITHFLGTCDAEAKQEAHALLGREKKHGTAMRKSLEMDRNVGEIWLSWVVHYPNKGYTKGIEGMKEICLEALKLSELISWSVDRLMTLQCHRYPMVSPHFQTKPNPSLECVSGIQKLVHVDVGSTLYPITSEYSIVHQRLVFRTTNYPPVNLLVAGSMKMPVVSASLEWEDEHWMILHDIEWA